MKKGFILGAVAVVAVTALAFGDTVLLNLNQLLQKGQESSIQKSIDAINSDILAVKLEDANKEADKNKYPGGTRVDLLKKDLIVQVDTLVAQQALAYQGMEAKYNTLKLKKDIEAATMEYLLIQEQLKAANANLPYYEKELAVAKTQQKLGMATGLQVMEKENALADKRMAIINLEQERYTKALNLEKLIGAPLEGTVGVDYKLEAKLPVKMSFDGLIDTLIKRQLAVVKAQQALDAKDKAFTLTDTYYDPTDKEYKEAKYNLEIARLEYQDAYDSAKIGIMADYENLDLQYQAYQLEKSYVALNEAKVADIKKKKSLGTASELEVMGAELQLRNKRFDVQKSIVEYNKAVLEFNLKLEKLGE